ncbi:MAG: tRNA uridine(34) 5-carboxymethylaminomethyl modification radical SAM/GNAT enzyme Elp3 [Candidatus Aenigmatarchaeota archaeon]
MKKPTRTISGVSPIAVVVEPRKCPHGACLYCPSLTELNVPQSYTPESPAIMRAKMLNYDPYLQVKARLKAFEAMGHPNEKVELIIIGGTFLSYPVDYQYYFIKKCYDSLNGKESKNLEEAKRINENSKHRCVGLCIETRPDFCGEKEVKRMLDFGATRCELGVQILDDEVYKILNRGHTVNDVKVATKNLRDSGFKIIYHVMPGLPGSNFEKDIEKFEEIFEDENFRPDGLKIYPCQVVKGSGLEKLYANSEYKPYSEEELINLLIELKKRVPKYCRIMRVMREISPNYLIAGTIRIDLRNVVKKEMEKRDVRCNCIRCREFGFAKEEDREMENLRIEKIEYDANGGKEVFLSFVNSKDVVFAICRLRLPYENEISFIRELHVYGPEVEIGNSEEDKIQHKGLGRKLLAEAEKISEKHGYKKIYIISGVGVRNYYRKFGYELFNNYMVRNL